MANRLAGETSPYLLQHRDNPVDWYPWGEEAFAAARREDKPILLSVGYSACHWCHVMAHESFEDPETARLMNERFVNVKVDREERPDIDAIYMSAVQAMTGSGGWPMTVVLTPDGAPFFGGTYFPPRDLWGRPSFRRVLESLSGAWRDRRDEVLGSAGQMRDYLERVSDAARGGASLDSGLPQDALERIERDYDPVNGGFGGSPKFPPHTLLRFLLAQPGERAREMAHFTLERMARGGIHDRLAGGFARYSVDERWLVPHFEKMLYDNALLLSRYSEAYALNADPLYQDVIEGIASWLVGELRDPGGGFYSALDADSEGEEGRYYVWSRSEFDSQLGSEAAMAAEWFGVTSAGNFEGRNVLTAPHDVDEFARQQGISSDELRARIADWRERLLAAREERVRPGLDDKILTSWNGLAIAGLADAGRVLRRRDLVDVARDAAGFLRSEMWRDGRLLHVHGGGRTRIEGLLEDYAYLGMGLLSLYRATFETEWLDWALELVEVIDERFGAPDGPFYGTPDDGEQLIVRPRNLTDTAVPADNAVASELFVHAGRLLGNRDLEEKATRAVAGVADLAREHPSAAGATLTVIDFLLHPPREIAVVGDREHEATRALLRIVQQQPLPYAVVAHSAGPGDPLARRLPFLQGRGPVDGSPAAFVCEAGSCRLPVTRPGELARELVEITA